MRKFIPITPETHSKLSVMLAQLIVKNKGKRVTFDQLINHLMQSK
jgi:hypothetical protein